MKMNGATEYGLSHSANYRLSDCRPQIRFRWFVEMVTKADNIELHRNCVIRSALSETRRHLAVTRD